MKFKTKGYKAKYGLHKHYPCYFILNIHFFNTFHTLFLLYFKGKPDRPGKLTVFDIAITKMILRWYHPDVDGGTPITGYIVDYKEDSSSNWNKVNEDAALDTTCPAAL